MYVFGTVSGAEGDCDYEGGCKSESERAAWGGGLEEETKGKGMAQGGWRTLIGRVRVGEGGRVVERGGG